MYSIDPFTRKDWYNVRAPCMFTNRDVGKTLVNRTQGTSECYKNICYSVIKFNLQNILKYLLCCNVVCIYNVSLNITFLNPVLEHSLAFEQYCIYFTL